MRIFIGLRVGIKKQAASVCDTPDARSRDLRIPCSLVLILQSSLILAVKLTDLTPRFRDGIMQTVKFVGLCFVDALTLHFDGSNIAAVPIHYADYQRDILHVIASHSDRSTADSLKSVLFYRRFL